jgi:hypothetical protein
MAVGFLPPGRSAIKAAQTGNGVSSSDHTALLQSINQGIWVLCNRLAPPFFRQRFNVTNLAVGSSTTGSVINAPANTFNAMTVNLTTGIVNVLLNGVLFYQVQAAINPFTVFLPPTPVTGPISFQTDPTSPSAANGTIDIVQL